MKKWILLYMLAASLALTACGGTTEDETTEEAVESVEESLEESVGEEQEKPDDMPERPEGEEGGDGDHQPPEGGGDGPQGDGSGGPGGEGGPQGDGQGGMPDGGEGGPQGGPQGDGKGGPGGEGGPQGETTGSVPGGGQMAQGGMPGGGSAPESYAAVNTYTADAGESGLTYTSTGTDENAVLVSEGAKVALSDFILTRESDDSTGGDSSSFYGVGAAMLVTDGTLTVEGADISTDAKGGAGVFAYDKGVAYISDSTIVTKESTSGGIHVAGGGILYAENLNVETWGASSAAIRSDRGGGTMAVKGGTYISNGSGSPAVYVTADISIEDATLTANGAEAVCIEGLNSLKLTNCDLTGTIPESDQNDCSWTVILYQSMSGDSEIGSSTFEMTGGSLTSGSGGLFYTTNTESCFTIRDVALTYSGTNDFFLRCTGNANKRGWGRSGANGAQCTFTAESQEMEGNVIWDSISTLNFTMLQDSSLKGAFVQDESCVATAGAGYANLTIDSTSVWIVTADSVLTNLNCSGTIEDADGNSVTIIGTDGTVYQEGTGSVTVTVESFTG